MSVVNWSERTELHSAYLRDCLYSGYLMCLVYGGFTEFPLGIYTPEEREALERSDNRPDETGASVTDGDTAIRNRYGKGLLTTTDVRTALAMTGVAVALAVVNGNLAPTDKDLNGNIIRRWDPNFTGGHFVCVIPNDFGPGKHRWLDPEAPWKYAGDPVSTATVLKWANGVQTPRYAKAGMFKRVLKCATTVRATPSIFAAALGTLPAGTACTVISEVYMGGYWTVNCGGVKVGKSWLHISANGLNGYAPTGRF